jgi:hypothetical protein
MTSVTSYVNRLAKPKPVIVIGARSTGRREYHRDHDKGTYSETFPIGTHDDWKLRAALCPALAQLRRIKKVKRK